ncbi:hypothetical protein DL95DRAFT_478152 [Leptodontidium sp. 2 PMI_412]|nr:hypothetical protein DL95DRAFT_478152 [Leptodontidium sp. 2 PMI_412]
MDSIPHRDDEMVIDEETFTSSSSHAISPSLFPTSSISNTNTTNSSTATAHNFPLADFYTYRHAGCLCKVKPETFPNIELQIWERPATHAATTNTQSTLWIIHPLHCTMCTWAESQRLKYTTKARCSAISSSPISTELKDRLKAYSKGVRDGRIEALSMPLDWSEVNGSEQGGGLARDMARLIEKLDLAKVDETDELAMELEGVSLEYDELTFELMRLFDLRDLREKGRLDGVGIQVRFEKRRISRREY